MCYERWRTRDRLLEYDNSIMPLTPHTAGLPMVYPWENLSLTTLSEQIFTIAKNYGYIGTKEKFWRQFQNGTIITGTISTFPIPGEEINLYFDIETNILYYFKKTTDSIIDNMVEKIGAVIVGQNKENDVEIYLYIPIRAMPIENLIYDSGDAAEYID